MTTTGRSPEPIIEPELPIVDAHHHLHYLPPSAIAGMQKSETLFATAQAPYFAAHARYLLEEFLADAGTGHNIRGSVFAESHAMYRTTGPEHMRPLGEIEFATGVAAMAESEAFGDVRVNAAIVGFADLKIGAPIEELLVAQIQAGGGRFRGVRVTTVHDPDSRILGGGTPGVLLDPTFREGMTVLHGLGLLFESTIFEPQLPDLVDLVAAFPDTPIVLTHAGMPLGIGAYAGRRGERFPIWREGIRTLAAFENVAIKIGGLGMPLGGFPSFGRTPQAGSEEVAADWRPYVETCVEEFGADRCMFESNFPEDSGTCSYPVLWNAFKRIVAEASYDEKTALFSGTASRVYNIDVV
jgi:predicted TIM-barrel fold metal-dependent hydrolase